MLLQGRQLLQRPAAAVVATQGQGMPCERARTAYRAKGRSKRKAFVGARTVLQLMGHTGERWTRWRVSREQTGAGAAVRQSLGRGRPGPQRSRGWLKRVAVVQCRGRRRRLVRCCGTSYSWSWTELWP